MNGLGLLVALAAVGIDVGWETLSSGVEAYTIRIEAVVVDTLRNGSAIESAVKPNERETLRQFRVVVGPKNQQTQRPATTANELDYGWSPNDTGGIDYYVQISPERLETLARGIPLECIVHRDVPAVDKIFIFVGSSELPRKLPQGLRSIDNSRYSNVAPASGTETNPNATRYADPNYRTPTSTQTNAPDASRTNGFGTQSPQGNSNSNQTYGPAPSSNYRDQPSSPASRYGPYTDTTLPVPPLDNSRPPNYEYNRNSYPTQQDPYSRPQPQQPYATPVQTAALPQQPPYNPPPAATVPVATQQPAAAAPAATMEALTALLALQQKQPDKATPPPPEPEKKSSKPLILTTLALFASIGANAYLGWLAWSFFWRFRDAASDLSRARSNAFPAGSVAGH